MKPEPNNAVNPAALLLQDAQGRTLGYVPDYLANELAQTSDAASQLRVTTVKVNPEPSPVHHRLLCRYLWTGSTPLFTGTAYEPLTAAASAAHAA